jgi:hypothetical protein
MLPARRRFSNAVVLPLVCSTLAVVGCGGSAKTHGSTSHTSTAAPSGSAQRQAAAPPGLAGVRGRVLRANELKGFVPVGPRGVGINAASWAVVDQVPPAQSAALIGRLERLGFVAGVREDLVGPNNVPGLSTVEQFHSAAAARAELADVMRDAAPTPGFAVPGIPGARGFGAADTGFNVAFAKRNYFYLVGAAAAPPGTPGGPTRGLVIAAGQRLYQRVGQ